MVRSRVRSGVGVRSQESESGVGVKSRSQESESESGVRVRSFRYIKFVLREDNKVKV